MMDVAVVMGIVTLIGMWKVFTKAGQPGWAVLVPIYNLIVLLRIAGLPWYWVFTPLIVVIPLLTAFYFVAFIAFAMVSRSTSALEDAGNMADQLVAVALIAGFGMILVAAGVVWVHHRISTRFGQGVGYTIGLTLLGPIFWLILGFGSAKYVGEQPAQA